MNKILYILMVIGCLFLIYKFGYAPKNNANEHLSAFVNRIKPINLTFPDTYISGFTTTGRIYKRGISIIGFKGLSGSIDQWNFRDSVYKKFFCIYMIDVNIQRTYNLETALEGKEISAYVNQDDLQNPNYGTKENPVPIFNFRGTKEPIAITSSSPGSVDGLRNLEPTKEEYQHNLEAYLTYIMSGKEFKERFEKKP